MSSSLILYLLGLFAYLGVLCFPVAAQEPEDDQAVRCRNETFAGILPSFANITKNSPYDESNDPYGILTMATRDGVFGLCGVRVAVTLPNASNTFYFEVFLPPIQLWNERFLTVGNYAFKGGITQKDMYARMLHGYATMATNTGHENEEKPESLMAWALNTSNPEIGLDRQRDWAWRALNYSLPIAKNLVEAYYSRDIRRSYYAGCSTGGRQGLKQIQIAADSFDGLLIGAPA
jgi:feruloyl esterase